MSAAGLLEFLRRQCPPPTSDTELLRAYADRRDTDAFRALLERHGPLVLRLCQRRLRDVHAAEDAFQATFLILARSAGTVRRPEALAAWLYGVALRVTRGTRITHARRQRLEADTEARQPPDPAAELTARELLDALDEELHRLPERYRLPLWLCYWQGLTQDEAARRLGWSSGSVKGRLERGRKRLADRLTRRGFSPPALLAAPLAAVAFVPGDLLARTATVGAAPWSKTLPAAVAGLAAASVSSKLVSSAALVALLTGVGLFGLVTSRERERPEVGAPQPPVAHAPGSENRVDLYGDPLPPEAIARLGTVRMRHSGVKWVAPLPDGRTLLSVGPTARVWDLATGKLLREFGPVPRIEARPALSRDGRLLAVPGVGAVRVWEVTTGRLLYMATDDGWPTNAYAFSPDGRLLVSDGADRKIRVRNAATGQLLRTTEEQQQLHHTTGLIFRDQKAFLTCDTDGMVKTWDVATGALRHQFRAGRGQLAGLKITPDGSLLVTMEPGGKEGRLWEMPAGREREADWPFFPSAFSPDGKTLAAGGWSSGVIRLWDLAARQERKLPFGGELSDGLRARGWGGLTFSLDGQWLLVADERHVIHCLDIKTGRERFPTDEPVAPVCGVTFTADGQEIRTASRDTFNRTYDLTGRLLKRQPTGHSTVLAPGGRVAVTWSGDEWWLTEPDTGRSWGRTKAGRNGPRAVAFAPDAQTFALLVIPPGERGPTPRMALQLFEVTTGKPFRTYDGPRFGEVLKFSPDGRILALIETEIGERRETVHLWDVATGRSLHRFPLPDGGTSRNIDFSPDSRLIAAPRFEPGQPRETPPPPRAPWVALLEVATGRERHRVRLEPGENANEIWSIRFTPDGRDLVLGLHDGTVRIWDLASGRERHRFTANSSSVTGLAFAPDGRLLASANGEVLHSGGGGSRGDGTVLLWPFPPRLERATVALPADRSARDALWDDLGSADAARAGEVLNRLTADAGGAVTLIRERLAPVAATDAAQIERWVADLDAPRFVARTRAAAELERLGDRAEPALRKALAGMPSAEVRSQIERLLAKLNGPVEQPEILRGIRAVEVLERIATSDARALLSELAKGDGGARLTREAKESLERLARRP